MENLNKLRAPVKKFCELTMPYDWDAISLEEAALLDSTSDEIASLQPKISKLEAMAILNNIGLTDLDGLGRFIVNCVINSRDWPFEDVLYIDRPSDPLSEFKTECLGLGLSYRFTSEDNTSITVNLDNYMEKYMELVPPLNRVDLRFIIATLGTTWEPDLPDDFSAHLRYLYENTPERKDWVKSDFSDTEKDWLKICFQEDRFEDPIYPTYFKLKSSKGTISLRSNEPIHTTNVSMEVSPESPYRGSGIPACEEYIIRVQKNNEIDIVFNPPEGVPEGYYEVGSLSLESSDGIFALDFLEPSASTSSIRFTADNSFFHSKPTNRHFIWLWVNSNEPNKVNKIIFAVRAQIAQYQG
jgi:hypothetical protein